MMSMGLLSFQRESVLITLPVLKFFFEERNYCYPNPCVNAGNCLEKENNFACKCLKGYKGNTCVGMKL